MKSARTGSNVSAMSKRLRTRSRTTAIRSSTTTASSKRWACWDLAKRTSACSVRMGFGRSSLRSIFRWRWRRGQPVARWRLETPSSSSRRATLRFWVQNSRKWPSRPGFPRGVFNFVTGPGSTVGQELIDNDWHRRHRVHRIEGSRDEADARQRGATGAAPADHRDGREESGDRGAIGRSRQGR